jgi:anaerobic magnesium-protoporphyrin IX monomethyl ester cyclase
VKDKLVVFINPPNTDMIESRHLSLEVAGAGDLPALGILTLASAVNCIDGIQSIYLDGTVCPFPTILDFISEHKKDIVAICLSTLSATYGAGLKILEHARQENPQIIHIVGNDHFTAIPSTCMENRPELIDYGIVGNEVIKSLCEFIYHLVNNSWKAVPGLVFRDDTTKEVIEVPQKPEAIFKTVDYSLLDRAVNHSSCYEEAYQRFFPDLVQRWFGRSVHRSISVEFARGCVKFRNNGACSFCSIQYGGMWRNAVKTGQEAWEIIRRAYDAGYDHLAVTADELPLTFYGLLLDMRASIPDWFQSLPDNEKPFLTGYARADGLCIEKNAQLLYDLGFRSMYVGVDAGPVISLRAFNKQLAGNASVRLDKLYEANQLALKQAANVGLRVDIGYVVGHIGMTRELLSKNIDLFRSLVVNYRDVIGVVDVNILTPEPGSKDFFHLLHPKAAKQKAATLGLALASQEVRQDIADKWKTKDVMTFEEQVTGYVKAFMPELTVADLVEARKMMQRICRDSNVQYGYS